MLWLPSTLCKPSARPANVTRYQSSGTTNLVASTNFTYDTIGRLSGIQHARQGAVNLNSYAYTYDGMSRLSSITSTAEGVANFTYDTSSQLKTATGTQPTESYAYDSNGNRNMSGYTTGTDNRTTSDGAVNYQYDAEGNLTRKTSVANPANYTAYEYDHRNRITRVELSSLPYPNNYVAYQYDAFNRLVRRFTVPAPSYVSVATYWVYDEGINPVLEFTNNFSGPGYITHRYLWSDFVDDLLADEQLNPSNNAANTVYPLSDHLGTICDIADFDKATGITAIANHRVYNSFGRLTSETGTTTIIFGYTGKLDDKTTGLQNNWNRWYDPNLGKWISQDPIGFIAGDPNLYRYVGNSPSNVCDPSGLVADDEAVGGNTGSGLENGPSLEELQRCRCELGRNRAMGGIALDAHGNGVPAGSFATDPKIRRVSGAEIMKELRIRKNTYVWGFSVETKD